MGGVLLIHCIAGLLMAASAEPFPVLLAFEPLHDAQGISLVAQRPRDGVVLMRKEAEHPKLWYAPVASRTAKDVVEVWYQRVNTGETEFADQRTLCLGELRADGWVLPALQDAPPAWGGPNNVCMRRSPHKPTWGGFNVFQIVEADGRLRMLYWDQPSSGEAGAMLADSTDGRSWTREDSERAVFTEHNDAFSLLRVGGEYLLYQTALEDWPDKPYQDNLDKKRRVQSLRVSRDLRSWTPQEIFLRPDGEDRPETEFYLMKAFRYGRGYLGLVMKYFGDPKAPGKHSAILEYELIASDDARTWRRPFRSTNLGFWSYADPFLYQGRLHFAVWDNDAMRTVMYEPNRMVAVHAEDSGEFTVGPLPWSGASLAIDADASGGWIEATVVNADGTRADSYPVARIEGRSSSAFQLGWATPSGSPDLRVRFRLHHADLYALTIAAGL